MYHTWPVWKCVRNIKRMVCWCRLVACYSCFVSSSVYMCAFSFAVMFNHIHCSMIPMGLWEILFSLFCSVNHGNCNTGFCLFLTTETVMLDYRNRDDIRMTMMGYKIIWFMPFVRRFYMIFAGMELGDEKGRWNFRTDSLVYCIELSDHMTWRDMACHDLVRHDT